MVQQRTRLYRYWVPPIVWAALIFAGSTHVLSGAQTGSWLAWVVHAVIGHPLPATEFDSLHFAVRKAGHLIEYFILGLLLFRALRADRSGWTWSWAVAAIAIAALYAASDEWHQSFVPSRTPSVWDVLIDTAGASLAQVLFFRR
jgi:VanZ family protein